MFFPGACPKNLFHLCKSEVALFLTIVEMRGNAHTGLWAKVDKDVPREKFAANLVSVRALNGYGSSALRGIFRRVNTPSTRLRACNQLSSQPNRFLANRGDANFIQNVQAGLAGVERRNVWSAIQIAKRIFARFNGSSFKCERALVRHPAREGGTQRGAQIFTDIQIGNSRAATEPFQNAANCEIDTQISHVQRNRSGGLKGVEDDVGAGAVRALDDRTRINNKRAAEQNL